MTAFVKRRELLLGLAALPVASHIAVAETYPSRPVRILVSRRPPAAAPTSSHASSRSG
jgi:hypothetical protein